MEDLKKKINVDPDLLYYSTTSERNDGVSKGSGLNVQETYNSSNRKHICVICGKRFFTQNSLKTHMEHHPVDKPIKANLEKDDNTAWKNRFVINKGISCVKTNCNFIALDSVDYSKHIAICEGIRFTKENSSAYCELCDCYYSSENYFKAHCVLQHPENGPNISLQDDGQINTKISDPVSLYVAEKNFESARSTLISVAPSMYPDSLVTKKKMKSLDLETSVINLEGTSDVKNENDINLVEPSVSEAVEILKTAIAADSQITNERSTEIYSENEIETVTFDKIVDENFINFEECTEISDRPTDKIHEEKLDEDIKSEEFSVTRDTDHEEQLPIEINAEEISSKTRNTDNVLEQNREILNSEKISAEILDYEKVLEKQLPLENDSLEIDAQTTLIASHNSANVFSEKIHYNLSTIEPTETRPPEVEEHDEMNDHGLQVLSEICETLSSEHRLMMNSKSKSAELENQNISCDNKSDYRDENGLKSSNEQADVQGSDVNNDCSVAGSIEKNFVGNDKPLLKYTKRASPPTTSEYHVLLAAAASLGDEISSINETSSEDVDSTAASKRSQSAEENSLQPKSVLIPTKRKYVKKSTKNELAHKSKNEKESDNLGSKQQEKHTPLSNSKYYQKFGKYLKTLTPKEDSRSDSRSPFTSGKSKVKRKRDSESPSHVKRKRESESFDSDNLNVTQRSVRQRKKLILPDFEYSLENKAEFSDSSANENSSSFSMGESEPVRKRGRPRKNREDVPSSKTSDIKTTSSAGSSKKNYTIVPSRKYSKNFRDVEEQSEEFCLNTTINETESDTRFDDSYAADVSLNGSKLNQMIREKDDDPNDEIHSWLNKVDFSEQTSFTSWSENPPKKKLGRPRKKRRNVEELEKPAKPFPAKVENVPKMPTICNGESNQVIIKKKKGRPLLKPKSTVIQQPVKVEPVVMKNIPIGKNNETTPVGASPRKRGRPCKVKVDDSSDTDYVPTHGPKTPAAKIPEAVTPSSSNNDKVKVVKHPKLDKSHPSKTQNVIKPKDAPSQIVLVKKRGRPRKSIASCGEDVESSKTLNVGLKSDAPSEAVIEDSANNQSTLIASSYSSLDHIIPSVTETNLPKTAPSDLPKTGPSHLSKTADLPKTVHVPKTAELPKSDDSLKTVDLPKPTNLPRSTDLPKPVDRPKPANSLKTVVSTKNDQSDSSSSSVTHKKRGRPLKKKKLLLNKTETPTFDESIQSRAPTEDPTNKNQNSVTEMDASPVVKEEELTDESIREPKRRKPTLWKRKTPSQIASEKPLPDETLQIDEALYHADLRNKSKYSKVFKKVLLTVEESQAGDDMVVCGRCQKKMTKRHYYRYHRISHYYLCWLENEPEIDLSDDFEINRILQSMVNPEALRKKAIRLSCERCDKVMKSVVGYVSHVRFCQKDEQELLEKCQLCPRALKPSSIRHHYIKFHGVTKFAPTNDSRLIPVACVETKKNTISHSSIRNDDRIPITVKNMLMDYESTEVEKVDILTDEHFWKSLNTSYEMYMCMGLNCRHMTLGKDDLKSHILSCSATFCEFSCSQCPYTTKYESEIIYHRKKNCRESSDSEDNAEEKVDQVKDRRISTRVRKRKFFYGYDDVTGADADSKVDGNDDTDVDLDEKVVVERKKKSKDDDFQLTDENSESEESNCSDGSRANDGSRAKSEGRSKTQRADILLNKSIGETGLRNAFLYHRSTRAFDPLGSTVEMRLESCATSPTLTNLPVDINEWETFPISDFLKYSPIQHKSPKVSFDGSPFVQFKVFDSDLIKGVPVCYTGGPVWSMAWAPLPAQVTEQYLAVAGLQHMNHVVNVETSVEFASIVQIWKYGSLDNISNDIHAPTLAWAIAHNYGAVWSMEWCPSGGFDNSSTPCRLGILALATSSGCCVLYSMPRLDCGGETRSIVANPEPDLILKVRVDDVQCTRIVWKRNAVPDTIYGGFSDGTIALWNIASNSSILKKGKVLYPYRTFQAHNAGITALDVHWMDNCRFMVSSSSDRLSKFWDLDDLSGPMYEHEHTNVNVSGAWMQHWVAAAVGADYMNSIEPTSFICLPRELTEKKKSILNIKDTFWSVAYSDWNDIVAVSSNGGCVTVFAAKHVAALTQKHPAFEKIVTQTLRVPLSEDEKIQSESIEADTGLPRTNDNYDCSSLVQNYGIKFGDRLKAKPSSENLNFEVDQGNFHSVNKVCWNQNYNSFNWLALGYDCGFVRVIRVERFDKSHLTKFYKLNENSTITLV